MGECGEDGGMCVKDVGSVEHVFGFLVDFLACAEDCGVERGLLVALRVEGGEVVGGGCIGAEERRVYLVADFGREAEEWRGCLGINVSGSSVVLCVWVGLLLDWLFFLGFLSHYW